jgi:hypothetical protein
MQLATQFHLRFDSLIHLLLLFSSITMSDQNLSLDGLSLSDEGLTLNLGADSDNIQILEHCLIGRVLTDKQIRFAYFKERLVTFGNRVRRFQFRKLIMGVIYSSSITDLMLQKLSTRDLGSSTILIW